MNATKISQHTVQRMNRVNETFVFKFEIYQKEGVHCPLDLARTLT